MELVITHRVSLAVAGIWAVERWVRGLLCPPLAAMGRYRGIGGSDRRDAVGASTPTSPYRGSSGNRKVHPTQNLLKPGLISKGSVGSPDADIGHVRVMLLKAALEDVEGFLSSAGCGEVEGGA